MEKTVLHELVLEDEKVKLSPLLPEHYALLESVSFQDPTLLQYSPLAVHSPGLLKRFIDNAQREREQGTRYAFLVFDKQKQAYAGSTSYGSISWHDKRVEIGWTWIGRDFQRTGLNRYMKFLMLQYVFEGLEFERLELRTDERNQASRTAITKIGCKFEGILRSHMQMPEGPRRNTVYYSMLKHEWPDVKKHVFHR